jgi:dihydrolipoamide dehydrogenase
MADNNFDVVIIGGGPGGYVAAIRAAQLGLQVAIVEKRAGLGGTCLNIGCIPSKALLQSSHHYHVAQHDLADHGVKVGKVGLDLKAMMARKDGIVSDTLKGVDFLMKKNKIKRFLGTGVITSENEVTVEGDKKEVLTTEDIIIATGSDVAPLPGVEIDEKQIVSSTGALTLSKVPKKMIVVGAGVIGLEMGSVWGRLGAEVIVVEFFDVIMPGMDAEVSSQMQKILEGQDMKFSMSSKVTGAKTSKAGVTLTVEPVAGGDAQEVKADIVLVAIGRRPYTDGLGLDSVGVETDKRGFIPVNDHFQTSAPNVYAIGDVIGGLMLAHKAEDEGSVVAEIIAGESGHINYDAIPGIVYTWPEVASLGKTEEQLKDAGIDYNSGKFPFMANARARAMGDIEGFVKILADKKTDAVLGVHIVGPEAGDLIQECVVAMEFGGSAEDIARTCHGHPGLSEVVKEAALGVAGRALHI